jgi:tetratricopeptide (TPR) repeat protein
VIYEKAMRAMETARPESEDELDRAIGSSQALASAGKYEEALAVCSWLIEDADTKVAGLRQRAAVKQQMRDHDGAIADLRSAIALFPHEPGDFYLLGILLLQNGATVDAIHAFGAAIRADADAGSSYYTAGALLFRAEAYLKKCDYAQAIADVSGLRPGFKTYIPGTGMRSKEQIFDEATAALAQKSKFQFKPAAK